MTPKELRDIGADYEKYCGGIIAPIVGPYRRFFDIYTKKSNELLCSIPLSKNPELEDKLRIKLNNKFNGKGSLPDLDYVIADKIKNIPTEIISIKGNVDDSKGYGGLWHHDVYKNHSTYPINYRVVTKDTKGTFASKDNGKHTKYYDFLTEDFRLYVDYGPEGYGTSRLESYNNSCSCNVVNPVLAPMVKDMLGFTNDLDESLRSYIKVNYPTEYELHYNKQTNTIFANNINQSFFNWQSS